MKNVVLLIIIIVAGCSAKPYIVSCAEKFEGSGQNEVYTEFCSTPINQPMRRNLLSGLVSI